MSKKDILLKNFTKFNIADVTALIEKYNLYNIYVIIDADSINEKTASMINRYGLNLLVNVDCVEDGPNSVQNIELRNPVFTETIKAMPKSKVTLYRKSAWGQKAANAIAVALSFPENRYFYVHSDLPNCAYYQDIITIDAYFATPEAGECKIEYLHTLESRFDIIDYGLLTNIGILGEESCILKVK